MADMGLATGAGISSGLLEGIQSALQMQNMMQETAIKKRMANAQSMEAFARLAESTTPEYARQQMQRSGLLPQDPVQSAQTSQAQPQTSSGYPERNISGQSSPGLIGGSPAVQAQTNDPLAMPTYEQFKANPNAYGKRARDAFMPIYMHEQMMAHDPAYQLELEKKQTDVKNAGLEQYNKGAESFKTTKQEMGNANDAFGKAMRLTDDPSPKNYQAALLSLVKLDMPGQAASITSIEQMEQNPQIMQRWGDMIKMGRSGQPTETSIKDLQRVASNMYAGKYENFKNLQADEGRIANTRGVQNPSYIQMQGVDKYGKLAKEKLKELGPYQAPTTTGLLADVFPQHFGAAKDIGNSIVAGAGNLADKAKGLLSAGNSVRQNQTSNATTVPQSIDPKDRMMMESEIKKNPNSPAAQHFKQVLKIYK